MTGFYAEHARRFGLAATAHYAAWRLRDRLHGYMPYRAFTRPVAHRPAAAADGLTFRELSPGELQRLAADPEYDISARFLASAQGRRDLCVAAFEGNRVVAYAFSSGQPTDIDNDFRFSFPAGWVYSFKAYTLPAWRGRRVHGRLWAAREAIFHRLGYSHMIALVLATNHPSLATFRRLGFCPAFDFAITGRAGLRRLAPGPGGTGGGDHVAFAPSGVSGTFSLSRIAAAGAPA